jgi:hypothetical protein
MQIHIWVDPEQTHKVIFTGMECYGTFNIFNSH